MQGPERRFISNRCSELASDSQTTVYPQAHNDYLEALIEGGVVRLALTLLIVVAVLWKSASQYIRHRRRTVSPMFLGAFFGLADIAFHSFGDFGMHIPAVALFAATVAAFVMGTADELAETSQRRPRNLPVEPEGDASPSASVLTGSMALLTVGSALLVVGLLIREQWLDWQVFHWTGAAIYAYTDVNDPTRLDRAADYLEGAVRVRPDDPTLWNDLAAARLAAALERTQHSAGAVAGSAAFVMKTGDRPLSPPPEDLYPALRAARIARNLCPILPGPHLRIGSFARSFAQADPASVYFDRARKVAPADPEVWFLSGSEALASGDHDLAWTCWREALRHGTDDLPRIVKTAVRYLSPDEVMTRVLTDSPALWLKAADILFPDARAARPDREVYLRKAVARWAAGPNPRTPAEWIAWGRA